MAGYPQGQTELYYSDFYGDNCWELHPTGISPNEWISDTPFFAPSEKEMMEFLQSQNMIAVECNLTTWRIGIEGYELYIEHADLTECLVQAVIAVLKGAK